MNLENEKTLNLNELIKMENEYDIEIVKKAYKEYLKSGKKSRPISELWQEAGIWYKVYNLQQL